MTLQKVRVTEQIHLTCIQTDKFKTGSLTFTVTMPLTRENIYFNTVLPGVLRRGTERYPDMASLNRRLDELYASTVEIRAEKLGRNFALIFSAELLDEDYASEGVSITDGVMEVISEMLLHPKLEANSFPSAAVEQEKQFERDALRATVNTPRAYAAMRLNEIMYRNDTETPTLEELEEGLRSITGERLAEHYRTILHASPLEVFYVGTLSPDDIAILLRKYFSDWSGPASHSLQTPHPEPSAGFCSRTEKMPVSQGKLAMGFRVGVVSDGKSDDTFTALVLNEIFGGSPASKLFLNVREKKSLCYYCASGYRPYAGIITVSSGIRNENRAIAEQAILEQMEDIRQGNISETEFRAAKVSLDNTYRQLYDNPFALQTFYENRSLLGIRETIEDCRRKVAAVRPEDVIALSSQVHCDSVFFIEATLTDTEKEDDEDA